MVTISNNYILINKALLLVIDIIGIWLALWVYFSKTRGKINRLFFLLTLSLLYWINGGYFFNISQNTSRAVYLGRSILGEVFLSLVIFYIFAIYFIKKNKRNRILKNFIVLLGVSCFLLTSFTGLVVKNAELTKWGVNPIYNPLGKIIFYILVTFLAVLILREFFTKYFLLSKREKIKVQYLLVGFFIFICLNLIFNVFFPLAQGSIRYWQFGNYSAIFLLGFTAYAIVKRELFGIKVVLTAFFVVLIAVLLTLDLFIFTDVLWLQFLKGGILL